MCAINQMFLATNMRLSPEACIQGSVEMVGPRLALKSLVLMGLTQSLPDLLRAPCAPVIELDWNRRVAGFWFEVRDPVSGSERRGCRDAPSRRA